jgi:hypothetical protein
MKKYPDEVRLVVKPISVDGYPLFSGGANPETLIPPASDSRAVQSLYCVI